MMKKTFLPISKVLGSAADRPEHMPTGILDRAHPIHISPSAAHGRQQRNTAHVAAIWIMTCHHPYDEKNLSPDQQSARHSC
jgi:hypothetical protein